MGWILGLGNGVVFRTGSSGAWSSYWTPSSAVVENAAPADVVLTYAKKVNPTDAIAGNFTIAGKTISGAVLDSTGKILTLTVTVAFVYGDSITVVANSENIAVTNNISAESELTTYITGLTTPLSSAQLVRINTLIKALKTGLSITNLSDVFDVMYVLSGETEESSLKNLVKNAHHCTNVNTCTFTQYEGFIGGATKYLNTNYNPSTQGINYLQNSASLGVYSRTDLASTSHEIGGNDDTSYSIVGLRGATNISGGRINDNSGISQTDADSLGLYSMNRSGSSARQLYKNNNSIKSDTWVSNGRPNVNIYICASNNNGTLNAVSIRQLSFAFSSRSLSVAEFTVLCNAVESYMDANGKGVLA